MTDNFKCIYKILKTLEKAMDFEEFDFSCIDHNALEISKVRWNAYMEMLLDCGYVKGVTVRTYQDGGKMVDITHMQITLKGLEYLSENTIMQRLYKAAKGIVDIVK